MILVDTSILIGYFKGIDASPYDKLDENNLLLFHNDNDFIRIAEVISELNLFSTDK